MKHFEHYDQLLSPILVLDKNNKIIYYNFICSTLFHSSPRKLKKIENLKELFQGTEFDFDQVIDEVRKNKSFSLTPEITFLNTNNDKVTMISKLIPDGDNIILSFLDFSIEKRLHDKYKDQMQELKDTHTQIVKADKLTALGEIISGISHEISTPLMIVDNRLELLYQALKEGKLSESKGLADKIKTEFDRMVKIFGGMKSIVKNQEDRFEIVDLTSLMSDVVTFFEDLNLHSSINLEVKAKGPHWVMANKVKLQQVLINLVKNSCDALGTQTKDPRITLEVLSESGEETEVIKVTDNGEGIPNDIKDSIFDMFFTSKSVGEGTGLGLSISRKIIESFSGTIELNDTEVGCEFEIHLPSIELGSFTLTNKYLSGESDVENDKILFIADDIDKMNEIYNQLYNQDYIIIVSHNTEKADDLIEFLLVDQVVKLKECEVEDFDGEIFDLTDQTKEQQLEFVEKSFVRGS